MDIEKRLLRIKEKKQLLLKDGYNVNDKEFKRLIIEEKSLLNLGNFYKEVEKW